MSEDEKNGIARIGEALYGEMNWQPSLKSELGLNDGDFSKLTNGHRPTVKRNCESLALLIRDRIAELGGASEILEQLKEMTGDAA